MHSAMTHIFRQIRLMHSVCFPVSLVGLDGQGLIGSGRACESCFSSTTADDVTKWVNVS